LRANSSNHGRSIGGELQAVAVAGKVQNTPRQRHRPAAQVKPTRNEENQERGRRRGNLDRRETARLRNKLRARTGRKSTSLPGGAEPERRKRKTQWRRGCGRARDQPTLLRLKNESAPGPSAQEEENQQTAVRFGRTRNRRRCNPSANEIAHSGALREETETPTLSPSKEIQNWAGPDCSSEKPNGNEVALGGSRTKKIKTENWSS
jgi:hypothetical protein